jgi:hypothetical protein
MIQAHLRLLGRWGFAYVRILLGHRRVANLPARPPAPPGSFVVATSPSKSATRCPHALHRPPLPWVEVSSCYYPSAAPPPSPWNLSRGPRQLRRRGRRNTRRPSCLLFRFRLPFTLFLPALPHSSASLTQNKSRRYAQVSPSAWHLPMGGIYK